MVYCVMVVWCDTVSMPMLLRGWLSVRKSPFSYHMQACDAFPWLCRLLFRSCCTGSKVRPCFDTHICCYAPCALYPMATLYFSLPLKVFLLMLYSSISQW